jgi:hydrogenase maturation protein HypF
VTPGGTVAVRLHVTGVVQGVGFRPFVHRLALRHGLAGWVRNASGEVEIALEGPAAALDAFVDGLRAEAPPLARIEALETARTEPAGARGFRIAASADEPDGRQPVAPDVALCAACEAELFDPADRRYRYPFITCTDCGPRYTVIEALPYDRERTSMRAFTQCAACLREYASPGDRRHHSETNSCPACGPRLWLEEPGLNAPLEGEAAIARAAELLRGGRIVALRGVGGFHLAADATDDAAVRRLRERKRREAKPFAVMVRSAAEALAVAAPSAEELRLLGAPERPIVVVPRRPGALAPSVAPGLGTVGCVLAYSPLHHLLLDLAGRPLVMTSGNLSDEPLAAGLDEARDRLGPIADALLLHDREIVARMDDSVLRASGAGPILLRRSRGLAPLPVPLPVPSPRPLVAVGPHLKNTFTLVHGGVAYPSPHVGDLDELATAEAFAAHLERYERLYRIRPEVAVRDMHPGYLSTRIAESLGLERVITVQHHHAHVAAVLAEHGETGPTVGLAFDGTGYGEDGRVWGAEFLLADLHGFRRLAHLRYAPLPGGDLAARTPWRAALGYAALEPGCDELREALAAALAGVTARERAIAERQIARGINAPLASSLGRLFDAAAAILGVRATSHYEGQAAMELEALAGRRAGRVLPFPAVGGADALRLDPVPLLAALAAGLGAGRSAADLAADFHESVAAASAALAARLAEEAGVRTVALGGGVFQNARLLDGVVIRLPAGLRALVPRRFGPNDGAVSYGQAAVGAALLARPAS